MLHARARAASASALGTSVRTCRHLMPGTQAYWDFAPRAVQCHTQRAVYAAPPGLRSPYASIAPANAPLGTSDGQ